MKFEVNQEDLVQKLAICTRFSSSKVQLPILANVLISASSNKINLKATNLEISISFNIGAKVIEEGSITVPARSFYEIVSNLSKGVLVLKSEKEQINISQEGYEAIISGINSGDFPEVVSTFPQKAIRFDAGKMKSVFDNVLFSVSSDDARPVLNGVLFVFDKDSISFVSTDGFRLTKVKTILEKFDGFLDKVIVPKNTLSEVAKIFQSGDLLFSLDQNDKQVIFSDGVSSILSSRIIDGEFPNFEKILPKEPKLSVDVSKEDFWQAIRLASVFAKDSSNVVTLEIQKDEMIVKSESSNIGKQSKRIFIKRVGEYDDKLIIGFNFHFLEELFKVVKGESLEMKISSPSSPVLFLDPKDKNFIHVIMPVKIE
ncbi:MAG: DNA polymerase III subunit beta [Patescibacteria group bacterium]|nr:DNA polymerase III subunit beta [Patescibacteria group bacterium]